MARVSIKEQNLSRQIKDLKIMEAIKFLKKNNLGNILKDQSLEKCFRRSVLVMC
jgi:hypothetical protein